MHRLFFLGLFLLLAICAEPKAPQLTPRDVKVKIEEILKSHAAYKKLTPEIYYSLIQFGDPGRKAKPGDYVTIAIEYRTRKDSTEKN